MTAEVMQIDIDAAQRRVERMRFHATAMNDSAENLIKVMHTARAMEDHLTLGYASWPALLVDVFGEEPLRLPREARRELVMEMSEAGMSTRAISATIGVARNTVRTDIREVGQFDPPHRDESRGVTNVTPDPEETIAPLPDTFTIDGMTIASNGDVLDGPGISTEPTISEHSVTEKVRIITGLDGKEYRRPEPSAPRAEPITSQFTSAIADLNRVMARFRRISGDKNFARNKEQIASLHASDLSRTVSELETLADLIS